MTDEPVIVRHLREFLAAHRRSPGPIVVAASGGPDSTALLRALGSAHAGPLVAAHLNHGLRGAASDADEAFVGDLVERLRRDGEPVEFRTARRSVTAEAPRQNVEAAARRIRYEWLAEVAREASAAWVLTGHTANDQAETVLFQLLRGTGLDGLAGIAPRRPLAPGIELVRPLLAVTRADATEYLRQMAQDSRTDATNADVSRTRSRIRHDLLPLLAGQYNPRIVEALCRLATQAADWRRDRLDAVDELIHTAERPRAGPVLVLDRVQLCEVRRGLRRAFFRRLWQRENWPRLEMGFREWDRLATLCLGGPSAIDLPGRIRARRRGDVIQVGPSEPEA